MMLAKLLLLSLGTSVPLGILQRANAIAKVGGWKRAKAFSTRVPGGALAIRWVRGRLAALEELRAGRGMRVAMTMRRIDPRSISWERRYGRFQILGVWSECICGPKPSTDMADGTPRVRRIDFDRGFPCASRRWGPPTWWARGLHAATGAWTGSAGQALPWYSSQRKRPGESKV